MPANRPRERAWQPFAGMARSYEGRSSPCMLYAIPGRGP